MFETDHSTDQHADPGSDCAVEAMRVDEGDAPLSTLDVEALKPGALGPSEARVVDAELRRLARADGLIDLCLAGALDQLRERKLHLQLGYSGIGDYGRECLGMSASQANQLARLGAELRRLPLLAVAMKHGHITLAKARLLIRVLDPREEEQQRVWLGLAQRWTVRRLAERVKQELEERKRAARARSGGGGARGDGGGERRSSGGEHGEGDEPEPRFDVSVAIPPSMYGMVAFVRHLAELHVGRKLSTGGALEYVFAEVIGTHVQHVSVEDEQAVEARVAAEAAQRQMCARRGDALGRLLEQATGCWELLSWAAPRVELGAWMEHLPREADELHRLLLRVRRVRARVQWTLGRLALLARRARLWQQLEFGSLGQYVVERLGISQRSFRNLVQLAADGQRLPRLDEAVRQGELGACAARLVAQVATPESLDSWVDYARGMTFRALEAETRPVIDLPEAMQGTWAPQRAWRTGQAGDAERQMCGAEEGPELEVDEQGRLRLTPLEVSLSREGYTCWLVALRACRAALGEQVPQWVCLYAMLSLCIQVWELDEDRRAFAHILQRDGYQCTVPGCSCMGNIHIHHIVFRSHGGTDADSNLTVVCFWHHIEGLHAGHVRCRGVAPDALEWELGGQRFVGDCRQAA